MTMEFSCTFDTGHKAVCPVTALQGGARASLGLTVMLGVSLEKGRTGCVRADRFHSTVLARRVLLAGRAPACVECDSTARSKSSGVDNRTVAGGTSNKIQLNKTPHVRTIMQYKNEEHRCHATNPSTSPLPSRTQPCTTTRPASTVQLASALMTRSLPQNLCATPSLLRPCPNDAHSTPSTSST